MRELGQNSKDDSTSFDEVPQFIAKRGEVLVKEIKKIGRVLGTYNDKLDVDTVITGTMKGDGRNVKWRVKLSRLDEEENVESVGLLDFDELQEVIAALSFIVQSAETLADRPRDYTEVTYETRQNVSFGYYLSKQRPAAFLCLGNNSKSMFFPLADFEAISKLIAKADEHLAKKGAEQN